ncbi:MAG: DUF4390 domain-containing protein [Desulfobacteria bacterium]
MLSLSAKDSSFGHHIDRGPSAGLMFRKRVILVFALVILFVIPSIGKAEKPELCDIIVTNTRDDLLLYFNAQGLFSADLKRAVLNGIPSKFTFFVSLYRVRYLWPDKELTKLEILHTIKYDSLRNEFTVVRSEYDRPVIVKSFARAMELMGSIDDFTVISMNDLPRGCHYQIRLKAVLDKGSVPFPISWNIETDWHSVDFIY